MDGIINVNKPAGMTSHDVVAELRRILREKKVGHTGTLDPDATGVLPVCLGKATKIIQFLQDNEKGYEGTITLGIVTDTLDARGRILGISDNDRVEIDDVRNVFRSFVGEIDQIPPMVSAIKVQGKRLYRIARQGKVVSRKPRKVHIYSLELLDIHEAPCSLLRDQQLVEETGIHDVDPSRSFTSIDFRVRCSRGTYVRVLAADIGDALECGAHVSRLVRTKSGIFELRDSIGLGEIQTDPQSVFRTLLSIDDVLSFMPRIIINSPARTRFLNGVPVKGSDVVDYEDAFGIDDLIRVHDESETLLGIGRANGAYSPSTALDPKAVICKVVRVLMRT